MIKSSRTAAALVVLVAVAMVGSAVASNMAFKINKDLIQGSGRNLAGTGVCTSCFNTVSLPDTNQFVGFRLNDICLTNPNFQAVAQPGNCGAGLCTPDPTFVNELNSLRQCGGPPNIGSNPLYQTDRGIYVQLRTTVADISHVFVGAHAPGTQYRVRQSNLNSGSGRCPIGGCNNSINLPYHTTAARLNDVCLENLNFKTILQTGSPLPGSTPLNTIPDPKFVDNLNCVRTCGGLPNIGLNCFIQIGKPVVIVIKDAVVGDVLWSPAHF